MYWEIFMKNLISVLIILYFAGTAAAGSEHKTDGKFTKHYQDSLFQTSPKGMFSVEIVIKEHELKTGVNSADLIVHDKDDKDVVGAHITVTPWMPEMGHGVFNPPVVTEKGGGLYHVENIILIMSGHWELRVNVKQGGKEDAVVFDFPDVKIDRGHEHKMVRAPADLDLSRSVLSDKKIFAVSYQSRPDPVPVNKLHVWTLTLKTADGKPVENAMISLDGDMPEHGHGLPTQPEVTEHLGSGSYLVEGLKFSMPGWWVMKFIIKAQQKEDSVTFNLLLKE